MRIRRVTVPVILAVLHSVKVRAFVLVAMETLVPPATQEVPMIFMPVEVTSANPRPARVPNAFVVGSKVYEIVCVATVDEGFVKTMVWFAV